MKLYHHPLSGHSHRARLFLSLIGVPHELVEVDLAKGAHKAPDYLRINPFGQVPALDDAGTIVTDSNAIMVYLARKLGKTEWLPTSPLVEARIQKWLSVAAGQIAYGPAAARLITVFGANFRPEEVIQRAHGVLALIEAQLSSQAFIAAEQPTIADVALYSYIARAPEGNVDLSDYPQVRGWLARIEALPGFVDFRRTPVGLGA
ncbi:glutathione S-transferase family protein [Variovorax sp. UMC13]|uniref:glutathione S-transferase family protein n=1 Tax=Variovorax sp. UMC13 TaxID=1862326 RepID=UPI001600EBC8|nr:glutathione S-transferase [Variovorax sp. UMC13]MBB1598826.1 glutathione S-transferase [Variovorax sp. UMC13]